MFATKGAGNTIAFTAQGTSTDAKGQVQFINRSGGTGQDQVKEHGTVSCIDATGNAAKVAGTLRSGESFNLFVEDNGEGQGAMDDMIFFDTMADTPDCDFDEPDQDELEALARGNAQVYDAGMSGGSGGGNGGNGNAGNGKGNGNGPEAVLRSLFKLL